MAVRQQIDERIKEVLRKNPQGLSITDIVREVSINRNTAGRYLEKLLLAGQVEMRHFGMAKIYALANRVPVSAVLSMSSELILQLDKGTRIGFVSDAFARFLSVPAAKLAGKNIEFTPLVTAFDDLFPSFMDRVRSGLDGTEWRGEIGPVRDGIVFSCRIAPTALEQGQKGVSVLLEDITEQKRAEERLRESEERYRMLAESSSDLIFLVGPDDRVEYVNSYAAAFLGTAPAELIGKARSLFFPAETGRRQGLALQEVFSTGRPSHSEGPLAVRGEVRWFDHMLVPLKNPDGSVRSVLGISRDISQRRLAEEALRESEERFRRIFEDGPLGITLIDRSCRFSLVNRKFCEMLGYTAEELTGRLFEEVTQADHRSRNRRNMHLLHTGAIPFIRDEKQYLRKDGSAIWAAVTVTPLVDQKHKVISSISIIEDITDRKEAEARLRESERKFREFADFLPQSVWECDRSGNLIFANRGSFAMFRYFPEDFRNQLTVWQMISPKDRPWLSALLEKALTQPPDQFVATVEFSALRKDGGTFPVKTYISPVVSNGEITGIRGICIDLTDLKQTEQALKESSGTLRAIFDSTFQFTGMVTPEGILIDANRTALDFMGVTREEVTGRPFWESRWWQGGAPRVQRLKEAISEAAGGTFVRYETAVQGAGTATMEIDFSLKPVRDAEGKVWLLIAEGRDITGRRRTEVALQESEERFRRVFEDGPLGMAIVGTDQRFISVNRRCCEMFGYTERELQEKTIGDVTHPDHRNQDVAEMKKLYEGIIPLYRTRKRYIRKDGSDIWGSLTVSPLRDRTGRITSTLGLVEDLENP